MPELRNGYDEVIIRARGLKKYFPLAGKSFVKITAKSVKAVDNIDLEIKRGKTLGLVGESGCGKTTLGRTVVRLIEPTGGKIEFRHKGSFINLTNLSPKQLRQIRRHMNMIFQDPFSSLNPQMNVKAIVAEPLILHKMAKGKELEDKVATMLECVGLKPHYMNRFPHAFSGGQRQRIAIARALISYPTFIVCDEPTSALDVSVQAQVLNLLLRLQEEFTLTYLFISHNLSVVRHMSDRIVVMYLGKVMEIGKAEKVCAAPQHPYTESLLSAVPIPRPGQKRKRIRLKETTPSSSKLSPGCRFSTRCLYAKDVCKKEEPKLRPIPSMEHHLTACHLIGELHLAGVYT